MARTDPPKRYPDWFDLERYDWIKAVNDHDLMLEVAARMQLYQNEPQDYTATNRIAYEFIERYGRINRPFTEKRTAPQLDEERKKRDAIRVQYHDLILDETPRVGPLVMRQAEEIQNDDVLESLTERDVFLELSDPFWLVSYDAVRHQKAGLIGKTDRYLHVVIDLNSSDMDITSDIKNFMPVWRKKLSSVSGDDVSNMENRKAKSKIGHIRMYRIIPLLDLLIWGKHSAIKLKRKEIIDALNEQISEDQLAKLALPLISELCEGSTLRTLSSLAQPHLREH